MIQFFKMNSGMKIYKNIIFAQFLLIVLAPNTIYGSSVCSFSNSTLRLMQSGSAELKLTINLPLDTKGYEVKLGDFPLGIVGGISENTSTSGNKKEMKLVVDSTPNAQTGSFMIPFLCRIEGLESKEEIIQLNLIVDKMSASSIVVQKKQTEKLQTEISNGILQGQSTNFIRKKDMGTTSGFILKETSTSTGIKSPNGDSLNNQKVQYKITSYLGRGLSGEQVRTLQLFLKANGFFPQDQKITGYFGVKTEDAVRKFQKSKNIQSIGIVGPLTRKAIEEFK